MLQYMYTQVRSQQQYRGVGSNSILGGPNIIYTVIAIDVDVIFNNKLQE